MQALAQGLESLVAALACAAFAHFGIALKAPCPHDHPSAHRIPASAVSAPYSTR
jgi:hypothetical protein